MPSLLDTTASSSRGRVVNFQRFFSSEERHRYFKKRVDPGCVERLRREMNWNMLGLTENNPTKFATSSWVKSQAPYAAYRFVCFVHAVSILCYAVYMESTRSTAPPQPWITSFYTWSFILYTIYHTMALVFTILEFYHDCLCNDDLLWYHKICWVLQTVSFNACILCFAASFVNIIASGSQDIATQQWTIIFKSDNVNFYAICGTVMVIDVFISNVTIRLLHVIYPAIYYVVFYTFHVYRWASGSTPGYKILDYGTYPGLAVSHIFVVVLALCPLTHVVAYGIDTIRWNILLTCFERHRRRMVEVVNAADALASHNGDSHLSGTNRVERHGARRASTLDSMFDSPPRA